MQRTLEFALHVVDFVLVGMIFLTHKLKLNPDNLATPLAASIGDVVSLIVLSTWATLLYGIHGQYIEDIVNIQYICVFNTSRNSKGQNQITDTHSWVMYSIIGVYIFGFLPMWVILVRKNEYTKRILTHGWTPVLSALIISGYVQNNENDVKL